MKDCKLSEYKIIIVEPCKNDLSNLDFLMRCMLMNAQLKY